MQGFGCAWQCKQRCEDAGDILMGEFQLPRLFCHLPMNLQNSTINSTVQMYAQFNTLADHPHIPEEAFLFLPKRAPNEPRDDFRVGEGKAIRRLLFEGWAVQSYTKYELERLQEFEEYIQKKGARLDPRWDRSWKMRFLLSTGCDPKKCLADMEAFIAYQDKIGQMTLTKAVSQKLRDGLFYVAGRDAHYRPLLVFDVAKIVGSEMQDEELVQAMGYFCEYVMRHLLIPGQVQNWVVIIDVAKTGVFSLVSSMKKAFSFLSDTFRSRMFACYVVRIPSSISFIWSIVKKFLEEETVRKINFFDEQTIEPLLEYCPPGQLERKFGGTLPDIPQGHFWPPREVSTDYKCQKEPVRLLTKQQYTDHYNNRIFYDTKFHQELILAAPSSAGAQMRENTNHALLKRIQKEFKIGLQGSVEDRIQFEKEVLPYSAFSAPLNFAAMLAKNKSRTSPK